MRDKLLYLLFAPAICCIFQVQQLPQETIANDTGITFNLTDIRSGSRVVANISLESIESSLQSFKNKELPETTFYVTLLSQEIPLNASQNTSQVYEA